MLLVNGATGFLGSHLVKTLSKRKIEFDILANSKHSLFDNKLLVEKLKSKSHIVHLAGQTIGSPQAIVRANIEATANLLEALRALPAQTRPVLVNISSFGVYAPSKKSLTETSRCEPVSIYGLSKFTVEKLCRIYAKQYGVNIINLRLSNIYGKGVAPYTHSVVATFFDQVISGNDITLHGDGSQKRDLLYVDDAVAAITDVVNYQVRGFEVLNVCSAKAISMKQLAKKIGKLAHRDVHIQYQKDNRKNEQQSWVGDNSKINFLVKWRPKYNIEEGLKTLL